MCSLGSTQRSTAPETYSKYRYKVDILITTILIITVYESQMYVCECNACYIMLRFAFYISSHGPHF